jgi:DNA modification methylase
MTQIVHPTNQLVALADLAPHPRNYNRHPAAQVRKLARSLRKFGQVRSVVVWRSTILAGHGVVEAAKSLNWQHIRADVLPDDYPEHLALAYVAADNELARQGDPDMAQLAAILEEVKDVDAELLEAVGYTDAEFAALLAEVGGEQRAVVDVEPQIDRAEELRKKWRVEVGQLWQLGEHRIICGDCTDAAVVARVMAGEKAALAPTDPPYNVGFNYDGVTVDDKKSDDNYERFTKSWFAVCQSVSVRQIVTPGCYNLALWLRWFDARHWAPWTKTNSMTNGVVSRFWCWEPVLFFGDKWPRSRSSDVFDFPVGMQSGVANHPCPKPLKMWLDLLDNYTEKNDLVYEPFSGSGTTLIACEQLGRRCRAVEIAPSYVAVALERWAQATGKTPEKVSDGG